MQAYLHVAAVAAALVLAVVGWLGWPHRWQSKYAAGIQWEPCIGIERIGWVREWRHHRATYLAIWRPGDSTPAAIVRDESGWHLQAPRRSTWE